MWVLINLSKKGKTVSNVMLDTVFFVENMNGLCFSIPLSIFGHFCIFGSCSC